jgi:hypothetical protein
MAALGNFLAVASVEVDLTPYVAPSIRAQHENLNLPAQTVQRIADRATIDTYQTRRLDTEHSPAPTVAIRPLQRANDERYVRTLRSAPDTDVLEWRRLLPTNSVPALGFRAPILHLARDGMRGGPAGALKADEARAAEVVARRLAHDGVLMTLAKAVEILGPKRILADGPAALRLMREIGFPADLLASFSTETNQASDGSLTVLELVARNVAAGGAPASLKSELGRIPFRFVRASEGYRVADESGAEALGLLRMQAGGGYQHGVVAGGSIDVINQVVHALPQTDFLISIPDEFLDSFVSLARHSWRLRRTGQATVIGEPLSIAAWAQDNGKAGVIRDAKANAERVATLTPRFASIGEGVSSFEPGESFLMDGLAAAGHAVAQSALLFQGGNLLALTDPKTGERALLMSEGTLHRNMALGLSRDQALTAFKSEFGVDRCVVLPVVSYHLDFDLSVRRRGGEVVAFVNDTMAAARLILSLGIDALARQGTLDTHAAKVARASLAEGRDEELLRTLDAAIRPPSAGASVQSAALSKAFVADRTDSGLGNLQTFLLAMDLLETSLGPSDAAVVDPARREYLGALRRLESGNRDLMRELRKLGWKLVAIPSMTDLYRGINYLNGIQHRDGYIMPAFGGFYAPLDQAALTAFREILGPELAITSVRSAACQRMHGGVHCTLAAYPRL